MLALAWVLAGCAAMPLDLMTGETKEPSLLGSYLAGRQASLVKDADTAARYYGRALAADPGNLVLLERTFLFDLARGEVGRALDVAPDILEQDPENPYTHLALGVERLRRSEYVLAIDHLMRTGASPFGQLSGGLIAAWADIGRGDRETALARLAEIGEMQSARVFSRYHEALIEELSGNTVAAEEAFEEAMYLTDGRSLRLVEAYGRFLSRSGRIDEAMAVYADYLSLSPNNPVIIDALERVERGEVPQPLVRSPQAGAAEALYGVASAFPSAASIELPLVYLNLAVHLNADFDLAYALMGDRLQQVDQWEQALGAFERIDPDGPLGPTAAMEMAFNLERLDRSDKAIDRLQREIRRRDGFLEGVLTVADLLRAQQRYGEALAAYDEALAMVGAPEPRHWSIVYARGTMLERLKRWPEAETALLAALELRPDEPLILNYLGYSWIDQGIYLERALGMIRRAVELRPDDGFIVDSLGWAYYRMGDYEKAVTYLERAVELSPGDPTINDHLGDAYWQVGRKIEARFQWRHALDLGPEEDLIPVIEEKLLWGPVPPEARI